MRTSIIFILFLNSFLITKNEKSNMGMYYYLIPETETECTTDFPSGLSYFFEQVGGYGEYATVSQLETELNIDLSLFQNTFTNDESMFKEMEEYGQIENAEKEFINHKKKTRIKTESILKLLIDFKKALKLSNDFAKKIKFNNDESLTEKIRVLCPPKIEYYNNGNFLNDINSLISTIECYKKDGVKNLRLGYE